MDIKGKFFPVGQGLTYAFKVENVHMLFDIRKQCNLKELEQFYGDKKIDFMILSHFHDDHMNGVDKLYKAGFSIKRIYIPYLNGDEQLLVELHFLLRNGYYKNYNDLLEDIRRHDVEITEVEEYMLIEEPIWRFNIHQSRGNSAQFILKIKNSLKNLGINNNDDLKNYIKKNGISNIKNAYQKLGRKSQNQTSIFLEHGPCESVNGHISVVFNGFEFLTSSSKKDKMTRTHSLITGDMNLSKNKAIISQYYKDLGLVLVPHHSAVAEWGDSICHNTTNLVWVVTIAEISSRPYGKIVQDIYNNNQELYICDKKNSFEYVFR